MSTSASSSGQGHDGLHELLGIIGAACTLLVVFALWSYDAQGGENWIGAVGAAVAAFFASAFGVAAWILPAELGVATVRVFRRRRDGVEGELFGWGFAVDVGIGLLLLLIACSLLQLALPMTEVFGGHLPGGLVGELLGEVCRALLGTAGSAVICSAALLGIAVARTPLSLRAAAMRAYALALASAGALVSWCRELISAWREAARLERSGDASKAPRIVAKAKTSRTALPRVPADEANEEPLASSEVDSAVPRSAAPPAVVPPMISRPQIEAESTGPEPARDELPGPSRGGYSLPGLELFAEPDAQVIDIDEEILRDNAQRLTEKLAAYGVQGRVDEIHPGPVVTMYEFEPESGTKISKIAGLSDDLAMALAAEKVRIVAPIPGKARVGFELPNDQRQTVVIREIIEDKQWTRSKAALPIALGKDIGGKPIHADLAKMPHLLVAGATGAGKSVGLNVMLSSLLAKKTPDEVRLLMIDPKVVELAMYDGIPHMLLPVVTDPQKASRALRWAVDEMERRYQVFADSAVRNIGAFNQRVDKVKSGELSVEKLYSAKARAAAADANLSLPSAEEVAPLPYIVVVVDEFADLMMVAAKDVEAAITRLAQKARAAGIHVILATQRPTVNVVTGLIKANLPSRIAFKVSQREDSKTILGRNGAEHLLGMGDMLFLKPGASDPQRVHGAYVDEDEVNALCDHLRAQGTPEYDERILEPREEEVEARDKDEKADVNYDAAVAAVAQAGYCSISQLQRVLGIGYNRAAKIVDFMEREGVVGPPSGKAGGRREVLVQPT